MALTKERKVGEVKVTLGNTGRQIQGGPVFTI